METTRRLGRGSLIFFFLFATVACSGGARKEGAPARGSDSTPEARGSPASSSGAVAALTRPKFSDAEYMAAITALEGANPATDAAADVAAGRRLLLAAPGTQGAPQLPGVGIRRGRLADDVRILRIAGFVDGSENRVIVRFQMLASRYATAYNAAMVAAAR